MSWSGRAVACSSDIADLNNMASLHLRFFLQTAYKFIPATSYPDNAILANISRTAAPMNF
ncbi:hypothetical protein F443_07801 [Phytophthora nicotianae P1569]|uniref:Uncharacterized protein n=1 Tax=Phytophthora nicotianae P1569 TaxID=1317065 RepID=V9FBF1_PHYNI|nr:hypothetical protein F443_07801 [Phytophthora nicotianae P1569]